MNQLIWRLSACVAVCLLATGVASCGDEAAPGGDLPDFLDTDHPLTIAAPVCITGPFTAKASSIEKTLVLLEEYINGDPRAYEVPVEEIPCRVNENCGAWMGTDSTGNPIRGPVRIVVGDTEEDDAKALNVALDLFAKFQPPAVIGGCTAGEVEQIFDNVTGLDSTLVSPIVSADFVSDFADRTPADEANDPRLPGYVYRTVTPDYVQVKTGVVLGQNFLDSSTSEYPLIRTEDETDDECTTASANYCSSRYGADYQCHVARSSAEPDRSFFSFTDTNCGDEAEDFCDSLGTNYACTDVPSDASPRCSTGTCCARYRSKKVCTRIVSPTTAMVLYEDNRYGQGVLAAIQQKWVDDAGSKILSSVAIDPSAPGTFRDAIAQLFENAAVEEDRLKGIAGPDGLPASHSMADSVVFIFTGAEAGALLFQEWSLQLTALPAGSDAVFWLGPDALRSSLVTNLLPPESIRNVYVLDPYTLDLDEEEGFNAFFEHRWGQLPDAYAGSAFDAGLLIVAANERAGMLRQRNGTLNAVTTKVPALGPNSGTDIKNSFPQVTVGCLLQRPFGGGQTLNQCGPTSTAQVRAVAAFTDAIEDLNKGRETIVRGSTGNLQVSPAGDRLSDMKLWKIASRGSRQGFYPVRTVRPTVLSIYLEK